jgi:hypothetical protein
MLKFSTFKIATQLTANKTSNFNPKLTFRTKIKSRNPRYELITHKYASNTYFHIRQVPKKHSFQQEQHSNTILNIHKHYQLT